MIIVSDTSPISNLLKINQLSLLKALYEKVILPESVLLELKASKDFDILPLLTPDWVEIRSLSNLALFQAFRKDLHAGEAEAIALALELNADVLLMDERKGRQMAIAAGLQVTGIVGVLLAAKGVGLIPDVATSLIDLEKQAGFWIGKDFRNQVLKLAGEMP